MLNQLFLSLTLFTDFSFPLSPVERFNIFLPSLLALLNVNPCKEVMLKEQLLNGLAILRVAIQTTLDKVAEGWRPSLRDVWHIHVNNAVDKLPPVSNVRERWIASRQLICEAPK